MSTDKNDQINDLTKSDQLLNLTNLSNGSNEDHSTESSVQKPLSVHSLNDLDSIKIDHSLNKDEQVKSDSQLNEDNFVNLEIDKSLNENSNDKFDKSLDASLDTNSENLKTNSLVVLNAESSSKSLNNLLIDGSLDKTTDTSTDKSIDKLVHISIDEATDASLNKATSSSADKISDKPNKALNLLNTPLNTSKSLDKTSSLVELNESTNEKLKEKSKQSTGSIDFLPNFSTSKNPTTSDSDRINIGLEDEMIIDGYLPSTFKKVIYYICVFLSFGMLLIYCETKLPLKIKFTHRKCSLDQATVVILRNDKNEEFVEKVTRQNECDYDYLSDDLVHFYHKKLKYIWQSKDRQFTRLTGLESVKCEVIYSYKDGLTNSQAEEKYNLYGPNSIFIDVQPLYKIVVESTKNPFYIYQVFIVAVWCLQVYYLFAACVFAFSLVTIAIQGYETRKQNKLLKAKVQNENEVTVIRSSCAHKMSSNKLVPGDLLVLNKACALNCDAVLIEGSCTVNEAMLTGECVPIAKGSLSTGRPESIYSAKTNKKNTLYCGTDILQVQSSHGHAKAIVVRTGYSTAKGELVRAILFPKETTFFLYHDLIKCMKMFFVIGVPCMIYTAYIFINYKLKTFDLVLLIADIATFLIPPLLPSVMTSINVHAQKRLLKNDIFCLNANFINSCGIVDASVFDKTGTLTEDSLDFASVLPSSVCSTLDFIKKFLKGKKDENLNLIKNSEPDETIEERSDFTTEPWTELKDKELNNLIMTVGCCHSLIFFDNKTDGDILDLKMFEQLDWRIINDQPQLDRMKSFFPHSLKLERVIETDVKPESDQKLVVGIVKEFQFESSLQRMMVIAKPICINDNQSQANSSNSNYLVLVKGAPEKIEKFCRPESVPSNYGEILYSYTVQGLRVIACASKFIDFSSLANLDKSQITDFEDNLTFDGFIVFHNKLKRQSKPTIQDLKAIDIRCLMATGDNLLTGVNVARNCSLVEEDEKVIQLKAELVDRKQKCLNTFIDRTEYVEYLDSDQQLDDKQIKLTYKILKDPNEIQHSSITKNFRKESHYDDKEEVIINMLDNSLNKKRRLSDQINSSINWLRRRKQKNRLNSMINDLDNEPEFRKQFHLCCEGPTFQLLKYHNEKMFNYLAHKGTVFARMAPNQKEQLITKLKDQEHIVAMLGDGANDCSALRNANCGLSLSSGESAVAAPFSTTHSNISVFRFLICEGKATISATFGAFKYQVGYCFLLLSAVLLLFYDGIFFSDLQYILADIVLNLLPPMVFGTTAACYQLVKRKPNKVLFGFSTLFSIFSYVGLQTSFYFLARYLITQQDWYEPFKMEKNYKLASSPSHIATTVISVNIMSYVISAIIFSPGRPFRKSFFSNKLYMSVVLVNFLIVFIISFYPAPDFLLKLLNFKNFPEFRFRIFLFLINIVNFIVSYLWEVIILQTIIPRLQEHYSDLVFNRKIPIYEKIDQEIHTLNWPPILFPDKNLVN